MTHDEIVELLPLYAAGSLNDEERLIVEAALAKSPELREEYQFLLGMKEVTLRAAEREAEGHITSEQLVDFAEGGLSPGEERLLVESHLQTCDSCRNEYLIVKELAAKESLTAAHSHHSFASVVRRSFRIQFAFPLLVVLAAAVLWMYSRRDERPSYSEVDQRETAAVVAPNKDSIQKLLLAYTNTTRGSGTRRKASSTLALESNTTTVELTIELLRSSIAEGYRVRMIAPSGTTSTIAQSQQPQRLNGSFDMLSVRVPVVNFVETGKYSVWVIELLKPNVRDIEPEEMQYEFEVRKK